MSCFAGALSEALRCLEDWSADPQTITKLEGLSARIADAFQKGGRVLICGNGGSLCDAMHFAEEFTGRFRKSRPAYAAIALSDAAHLTCVANDFGFEEVFARGVQAYSRPGDLLILLTTSGTSENLIRAALSARENSVFVAAFTGRGGGRLVDLADWVMDVPGVTSDRIQELHMIALHSLIEDVERILGHD